MPARSSWILLLFAAAIGLIPGPLSADLIKLKAGGELRGQLDAQHRDRVDQAQITIRTLTGGTVIIAQIEIQFVARRPLIVEEYETQRRRIPHTIEAHWELAEWCRTKGLKEERAAQLEAILEIDSEHVAAHRGLGHIQHEGEWTTRDAMMTAQGYVKYKNRYVLPQELELLVANGEQLQAEQGWYRKVHMWKGWLTGPRDDKQREAFREFQKLDDRTAIPALVKNFRNEPAEGARAVYIGAITRLGGPQAIEALAYQALQDASPEIRRRALDGIPKSEQGNAIPFFAAALKHDLNAVVVRAAAALRRIGDREAIPHLIDALVTKHSYKVTVWVQDKSVGYSSGGIVLPPEVEAALLTGQLPYGVQYQDLGAPRARPKVVTIRHNHENAEVLAALTEMTGERFGYDERTWRLWWQSAKKTSAAP